MIRNRARIALFVAAAALGACGGEEHGDLKQELAQLTKDGRGGVEALPQVRPYEPVPYTAEGQIDPFRPERIDVAQAGTRASGSKLAPDPNRPKEPLAPRTHLPDASADQDRDRVAHRERLGAVVRHEDRGRAGRLQQGADFAP